MPPPRTMPFAPKLRLWPESLADIEKRLRCFLVELRRKRFETKPASAESAPTTTSAEREEGGREHEQLSDPSAAPHQLGARPVELSYRDGDRISRRAKALVRAREAASGVRHLKKEDVERLQPVAAGVTLVGPGSEHEADEVASRLLEEMPWHARVLEILWRDMRVGAREGQGLRFRPVLLDGAPGLGKTHLALRLAELTAVPFVYVDVATSSEGFTLSGAQRTWGSASPGRPVSIILQTRVGNPLVFVDEVEKGGTHHSSKGGVPTSAHLSLLSLLEPTSAAVWECPYFGTTFDMSHVNWLLASNDARRLPPPLASRLRVVPVRGPTRAELLAFAARELARRGLDPDALGTLERLIHVYPEGDERLSLRTVLRLIEDLAALARTTEVTH